MRNNKGMDFPLGTIVSQILSDKEWCIGIVVDRNKAEELGIRILDESNHIVKDRDYVLLVLGHSNMINARVESIFRKSFEFPTCVSAPKEFAYKLDLEKELELFKKHLEEKNFVLRKLNQPTFSSLFSFSETQERILIWSMVAIDYMSGKSEDDIRGSVKNHSIGYNLRCFLEVLANFFPSKCL